MHKKSFIQMVLMLFLYFIGYVYILPFLLTKFTLWINPYATSFHPLVLLFGYCFFMGIVLLLSKNVLKKGLEHFRKKIKSCVKNIIFSSITIVLVNLVLSIIVSIIFQTNGSANQQSILEHSQIQPVLIIFASCIFAPVVEECVFRGSVLSYFQQKHPLLGLFLSSVLFGFIHVMDSIFVLGVSEIGYWGVYSFIGVVLGISYLKTQSIYVCIAIHALNNILACLLMFG